MANEKPRVATRREFMNKLIDPYEPAKLGNPNSNYSETITPGVPEFNRSYEISQKGDVDKDVSVGFDEMDTAIQYHFENKLELSVLQNGQRRVVPVVYGSPERWKSIQADGYFRDTEGKIQVPLVVYRREGIEPVKSLGNKLDGNLVKNFMLVQKSYNNKNMYGNFSVLTNRVPEKSYNVAPIPDYVNVTYQCIVYTYFVEQMNGLIEVINFASDSYWGNPSTYVFRTKIDNYSTAVEIQAGDDRMVKSEFKLTLSGYIIPDSLNREVAVANRLLGPSQIQFGLETANSSEIFNTQTAKGAIKPLSAIQTPDSVNVSIVNNIVNNNGVSSADLDYLATSVAKTATTVTQTTATFPNTYIKQPPTGSTLPAPTKDNFIFYANGITIPGKDITYLYEVGSDVVVAIEPTTLGYYLTNSDGTAKEIIGVGKFG